LKGDGVTVRAFAGDSPTCRLSALNGDLKFNSAEFGLVNPVGALIGDRTKRPNGGVHWECVTEYPVSYIN
jgi:hypothetical protein